MDTDATKDDPIPVHWVILQWCSTGFLWSQWLIQDLANLYVYLPREINAFTLSWTLALMIILHALIFYFKGGAIQKVVTSKTNVSDIRVATIVDLIYGLVLFFFKNLSNIPMSTTWVFLGVLAGREIAITLNLKQRTLGEAGKIIGLDMGKALIGLAVSVAIALGVPLLA